MPKRVLLAGLFHETNTFLEHVTRPDDFEAKIGDELWEAEGDSSPLGGALHVALEKGWEVIPAVDLRATPDATVADEVVNFFWEALQPLAEREARHGLDGVFLVLHGAMVSESYPDVEGEILRRIRTLDDFDRVPICGVLDLHANFTEEMALHSDGLLCYRENPHADARSATIHAALLLDRLMESGERPTTVWKQPRIVWPPSGTGTGEAPMQTLEERAREIEQQDSDVLAANVFAGFSFADTPDTGVSFSLVTVGDSGEAHAKVQELASLAWSLRGAGNRSGMPIQEAMERLKEHGDGPILLVEPSDNIGAGAPGDGTHVLRAFVEHEVRDAGVIINDPGAVQSLQNSSPGDRLELSVGGKSGAVGSEPIELDVELISKSDGRFELEDKNSHLASMYGTRIEMGPCAVVQHKGVTILLTSRKTPPFDLGQWRSQGINPEDLFAIGVKAAAAHRRVYDPIAKASYTLDVPGSCAENLGRLPYEQIRRPVYPLDDSF